MRESELEARLVRWVRALGGVAYKFVSPGNAGVPDRLVVLPGGLIRFVELKTDTGRLGPMQGRQLRRLEDLGAWTGVLRGEGGVADFLLQCRRELETGGGAG